MRHYALSLVPDHATQSVRGQLAVTVDAPVAGGRLQLDAPAIQIESVSEDGRALAHERNADRLVILLPPGSGIAARTLDIRYRATPARGLLFANQRPQLYTIFSTAHWMPCDERPASRATLSLTLTLPAAWQVAASGELTESRNDGSGRHITTWQLSEPHACYLYGFVAGEFREVIDDSAPPRLRYLVPPSLDEAAARRVFAETRSMLRFYEERAGFRYPATTYTQALVSGPAAQEMAGLGVLGERYATRVLADPQAVWLGAHELSHEWWGNRITNAAWTHFWLNEGIASFMNAAWLEHRFGAEVYARQLEAARQSYRRVVAAGRDRPLVFPDWNAPTAEDRALVYDKGMLALVRLREILGETDFWAGLRLYSRRHRGEAVLTPDFQKALEEASGRDLQAWFQAWAYGAPTPKAAERTP